MFGHYSERAARVITNAQDEARHLNTALVGTEHLLAALLKDAQSIAVKALCNLGIDVDGLRATTEGLLERGTNAPAGQITFTPACKSVIMEHATEEARALGHNYVGTEHLLLGLLRDAGSVTAGALVRAGATVDQVRAETVRLLQGGGTAPPPPSQ